MTLPLFQMKNWRRGANIPTISAFSMESGFLSDARFLCPFIKTRRPIQLAHGLKFHSPILREYAIFGVRRIKPGSRRLMAHWQTRFHSPPGPSAAVLRSIWWGLHRALVWLSRMKPVRSCESRRKAFRRTGRANIQVLPASGWTTRTPCLSLPRTGSIPARVRVASDRFAPTAGILQMAKAVMCVRTIG